MSSQERWEILYNDTLSYSKPRSQESVSTNKHILYFFRFEYFHRFRIEMCYFFIEVFILGVMPQSHDLLRRSVNMFDTYKRFLQPNHDSLELRCVEIGWTIPYAASYCIQSSMDDFVLLYLAREVELRVQEREDYRLYI